VVGSLSPGSILVATAVNGRKSGTASAAVEQQDFFQLPMIITRDIVKILGIVLTPEENEAVGRPHTKNFKAFLFYGQGLDALDQGNWQGASEYFMKALEQDPRFDLAAEALASCPGADAPPISQLAVMTGPQLAIQVEEGVQRVLKVQSEEDLTKAGDARGGKEGDGGNGGGH
jgi:hypothetical protein